MRRSSRARALLLAGTLLTAGVLGSGGVASGAALIGLPLTNEAAAGASHAANVPMSFFLGIMLEPLVSYPPNPVSPGFISLPPNPIVPPNPCTGASCRPGASFITGDATEPEPSTALAYAPVYKAPVTKLPPPFVPTWSAWASAFAGVSRVAGDPALGTHDLTAHAAGGAAGLSYQVTPDTVLGLALAGGGASWSVAQVLGGGRSDTFQGGAYGATHWGPVYLAASLAFANNRISTDRFALGDYLTARFTAESRGGRVEIGDRFGTPAAGFTPYAAVQRVSFRLPSYSETDLSGGFFGLTFAGQTSNDVRSEVGARFDQVVTQSASAVLAVYGRAAWAHDRFSNQTLFAAFEIAPSLGFPVTGATPATNSALVTAGTELRLASGVALGAKFDGDLANRSQTYAGTATVRVRW
jgi:outer membrane autotransporter protein